MHRISQYDFGRIVVDGVPYNGDIIVLPGHVVRWRRKEGHRLRVEDLSDIFKDKPEYLVIGTGYDGMMEVPSNVVEELRSRGISTDVCRTREAVGTYNSLVGKGRNVVAALHLTC